MNDVDRILALSGRAAEVDLTDRFRRRSGKLRLRPVQSQILLEAYRSQGLVGFVPVGAGKTLAFFLLPWVLEAERPLLLIPASVRVQCIADWAHYGRHFNLPSSLNVRSYAELSRQPKLLSELRPDAILCDECQRLSNPDSTRTKRLGRYVAKHHPKLVGMSGTMTTNSVEDFEHLMRWALRDGTPLPLVGSMRRSWFAVLSRSGKPTERDVRSLGRLVARYKAKSPRDAFASRLRDCKGVVHMADASPPARLVMASRKVEVPDVVQAALDGLATDWSTPGGDELDSILSYMGVRSQIACGFYYIWDWPGQPDTAWLQARNNWNCAVRRFLSRGAEGLDSPALVRRACERLSQGEVRVRLPKSLMDAFLEWRPLMGRDPPPLRARWLSDYLVEDIERWVAEQRDPPLVWYGHHALGVRASKLLGLPMSGAGDKAAQVLAGAGSAHARLVSVPAHHYGKNLQLWGNQLIAHPIPTGALWEQMLGRTHRANQLRDEVLATYYDFGPFEENFLVARRGARYIEETTGQRQRLNYADYLDPAAASWASEQDAEAVAVAVSGPDSGSPVGPGLVPEVEAG